MTNAEYRKLIAKNIKRIAYDNHKSQADIVRDLGLKQPTVSAWMNGTRMIQMPEIDLLCHYFNCNRADIMEEKREGEIGRLADLESTLLTQIENIANDLTEDYKAKLLTYAEKLYDLQKTEEDLK